MNIFGFLGADELRARDAADSSTGNYGIQDQRLAFKWVHQNIAAFGGDPALVTLFGQSAGAGSITQHYVRSQSWGYFSSAIFESGSFVQWASNNMTVAQSTFETVAMSANCQPSSGATVVECLMSKSTAELLSATNAVDSEMNTPYLLYAPVSDYVEASTHPWIALANKQIIDDAPVMLGSNRDEAVAFSDGLSTNMTEAGLIVFWAVAGFHTGGEIKTLKALYMDDATYPSEPEGYSVYWWAAIRSYGDSVFSCPARYAAESLGANSAASTFLYFFEHLADQTYFATHSDELPYVFQATTQVEADKEMEVLVGDYWGSFIQAQDPNIIHFSNMTAAPNRWSPFTQATDLTMDLTTSSDSQTAAGLKLSQCDFFIPIMDASIRKDFSSE